MSTYHILNGDSLKEQFPEELEGELIVTRECLVSGPVRATSLEELFNIRARFIQSAFDESGYHETVVPEIKKLSSIKGGNVNLWFEEDLFCQINLWFVCSQLYLQRCSVDLVLPSAPHQYGFGGMSHGQLIDAYRNRMRLTEVNVNQFALLWFAYRDEDIERMLKLGVQMHGEFPFVMTAIEAHFDRLPTKESLGKPAEIILKIMDEKSTKDFNEIFREFHKRAPIYGFGDLQVKAIYDEVIMQM